MGLYPSIPHEAGLEALYEKLEERVEKKIPSSDLVNMAEFVLKNNYLEFDSKVKKQISGTAIGTKSAPPYACIFMDKVEREFLEAEDIKPWVWLRYIDDIFFIWTEGENKLESFLQRLNTFHPNLKFTHEKSKTSVNFLDVVVRINGDKFETGLYRNPLIVISFLNLTRHIPYTSKNQLFTVKGYVLNDYVRHHWHLKNTLRVYVLGLGNAVTPRKQTRAFTRTSNKTRNWCPTCGYIPSSVS